jgi:hypothetical protein
VGESTAMKGGSLILGGGQRTVEALVAVRGFLEGWWGCEEQGSGAKRIGFGAKPGPFAASVANAADSPGARRTK